jgi:hypothetical protein
MAAHAKVHAAERRRCLSVWLSCTSVCLCLQFVETNKELLSELPPPMAAAAYYRNEDLYMVSQWQALFIDRMLHAAELSCPELT